jgi:hypothetical protein
MPTYEMKIPAPAVPAIAPAPEPLTVQEAVKSIQEQLASTGSAPSAALFRVLGDPSKIVSVSLGQSDTGSRVKWW